MTAPSISIKDVLVAASIGVFGDIGASWPIWIGRMPEKPDNAILLTDSGGGNSEAHWLLDFPTVSIIVRNTNYLDGYNKAKEIKDKLHTLPSQTINGDRVVSCLIVGDINYLGTFDKDRPNFSLNFRMIIEPANASGDNRVPL